MANRESVTSTYLALRERMAKAVSSILPLHDVEDVVQESYVRLIQASERTAIDSPRSYLLKTVRNLALDRVKRADARLNDPFDETAIAAFRDADEVYNEATSREDFGYFCEAVRRLPVQARRVFVLKKVYGYSQREIAEELGLSESTVEKHVALAIRRCAQFMAEHEWGEESEGVNQRRRRE